MKKHPQKHRFFHPDPEKIRAVGSTKGAKAVKSDLPTYVLGDLKKTIITVSLFIAVLIGFWFLSDKYHLLELIKDKLI